MRDGAEILMDNPLSARGRRMLTALADTAPPGSAVTAAYSGQHRLLVMYGAGLAQRTAAMQAHRARGGRVAAWDLGYWDPDDAMRVAIDGLHPTPEQMARVPAAARRLPMALRQDADPSGPVLLIGMGIKSCTLLGLPAMAWERRALARIRQAHPGRRVLWRPKGRKAVRLNGTVLAHGMPIETALRGCSLLVTRHSNCAVDACIAGVPVWCEAGAALALYQGNEAPDVEQRADFLRRLAWFNWAAAEAPQAWAWLQEATA